MYQNLTFPHELENVGDSRKKGLPRWGYLPKETGDRRDTDRFDPWAGKIPWKMAWQTTPAFLARRIPMERGA